MLVFKFYAKHRVWQRLNYRGHYFYGVLFGISRVAFLFFLANRSRHMLLRYQRRARTQSLSCALLTAGTMNRAPTKFATGLRLPGRAGHFFRPGQNPRIVGRDRYRMLEVG